jgi:hypothetical protein
MEIMRNLENRMLDKRIEGMQPLGVITKPRKLENTRNGLFYIFRAFDLSCFRDSICFWVCYGFSCLEF